MLQIQEFEIPSGQVKSFPVSKIYKKNIPV